MYTDYLGIKEKPFSITPDPRYLYMSRGHQEALAHLTYGIMESGGFVVLTGEVGTGKTSLCRCLLEQLPDKVEIALILNPVLTRLELVAAICDEFGVEYPAETESLKRLIDLLNAYLLEAYAQGKHCVLMIDEAQNLAPEVLEQVRLLTNLETDKKKLLQIILVGQPELNSLLQRQDMRQLNQRITARYHLTPLSEAEMRAYVRHRLSVAGLKRMIFTSDALATIFKKSGGVPRLVNIICDACLLAAYAVERGDVDRAMALSAAKEVLGPGSAAAGKGNGRWRWAAGVALAAAIAGIAYVSQTGIAPSLLDNLKALADHRVHQDQSSERSAQSEEIASKDQSAELATTMRETKPTAAETTSGHGDPGASADPAETLAAQKPPAPEETIIALSGGGAKGLAVEGAKENDASSKPPPPATPPFEGAGLRSALEGLFALWDASYQDLEGETPCSRARDGQLACLLGQDGWAGLRNLNRPALITLDSPERGRVHALITGLEGEQVTLQIGGKAYESTIDALAPYWSGEYLIFWRPPGAFRRIMRHGLKGPDVYWLRLRLAAENEEVGSESDSFDSSLHEAVVAFQESRALTGNGVVDARTLVHLNSLDPTSGVPLLNSDKP